MYLLVNTAVAINFGTLCLFRLKMTKFGRSICIIKPLLCILSFWLFFLVMSRITHLHFEMVDGQALKVSNYCQFMKPIKYYTRKTICLFKNAKGIDSIF